MFVSSPRLLTAAEALRILSVRRQTLYAYVSKGWIRSVSLPNSREHRYVYEDVQRVHQRALARAGHRAAASVALSGDTPLISSAISELRPDGPWYRGHSALDLARQNLPFEAVCHLLWQGHLPSPGEAQASQATPHPPFLTPPLPFQQAPGPADSASAHDSSRWHQQFASCLLAMDSSAFSNTYADGQALLRYAIGYLGYVGPAHSFTPIVSTQSCVQHLRHSLGLAPSPLTEQSLNRFLITFCEHELSPSTFAVRTAASVGTTLTTALASALAVTTGRALHGVYTELQCWLERYPTLDNLQAAAAQTLSSGHPLPGYNHPVYRDQDARSNDLLHYLQVHYGDQAALQTLFAYVAWLSSKYGLHPHHEFACTAFGLALGLPPGSVPALFVVARLAGWIAHFHEQTQQGQLFRPRAHFANNGS